MGSLSQRLGVALLMLVASTFAANHIAARLAFDHGASVAAAVAVRSGVTALALVVLMRVQGVSMRLAGPTLGRGLAIGLLVAVQSFCLYSAVARIPVSKVKFPASATTKPVTSPCAMHRAHTCCRSNRYRIPAPAAARSGLWLNACRAPVLR